VAALLVALLGAAATLVGGGREQPAGDSAGNPSGYAYQTGEPGLGQPAPPIQLSAASGDRFDLSGVRGETVLLYFQEGLMCQPCWDQLAGVESRWADFERLGIDQVVTITTDSQGALSQKADIEGLTSTILGDPDQQVSRAYGTLDYGMMRGSANGHTFIVVDPQGRITWRADYGGAPDYTMYLPVDGLLADLRAGLNAQAPAEES